MSLKIVFDDVFCMSGARRISKLIVTSYKDLFDYIVDLTQKSVLQTREVQIWYSEDPSCTSRLIIDNDATWFSASTDPKSLLIHVSTIPLVPVVIATHEQCSYCNEQTRVGKLNADEEDGHYRTCLQYPVTCDRCTSTVPIPRLYLSMHQVTCPGTLVECPYAAESRGGCKVLVARNAMENHLQLYAFQHLQAIEKLTTSIPSAAASSLNVIYVDEDLRPYPLQLKGLPSTGSKNNFANLQEHIYRLIYPGSVAVPGKPGACRFAQISGFRIKEYFDNQSVDLWHSSSLSSKSALLIEEKPQTEKESSIKNNVGTAVLPPKQAIHFVWRFKPSTDSTTAAFTTYSVPFTFAIVQGETCVDFVRRLCQRLHLNPALVRSSSAEFQVALLHKHGDHQWYERIDLSVTTLPDIWHHLSSTINNSCQGLAVYDAIHYQQFHSNDLSN